MWEKIRTTYTVRHTRMIIGQTCAVHTAMNHCAIMCHGRHRRVSPPFWSPAFTEPIVPQTWRRMPFGSNLICRCSSGVGSGYVLTVPKGNFVFTSVVDCWPWSLSGRISHGCLDHFGSAELPWHLGEPHPLFQLQCCLLLPPMPTWHKWFGLLTAFWGCLGTPEIPSVLGQIEFCQWGIAAANISLWLNLW